MCDDGHVTTNSLELYVLGRLGVRHQRKVFHHLTWCLECNDRLLAVKHFIDLVRAGAVVDFGRDYGPARPTYTARQKSDPGRSIA